MTRASSVGRFVVAVVTALAAHAGCTTSKTGGETHWLGECATDRECGTAQCLCGVCSRACAGDGDCAGPRSAQCYAVTSPGIANQCGAAMPKGTGICLAVCNNDGDCPAGDECHLGACVAAPPPAAPEDAAPPAAELPPTGDIAARYVHTDAGTAFGEVVAAPEPTTFIDGNAEDLVGVWEQTEGDAGPCVAPYTTGNETYIVCLQLEITREEATGKFIGHVSYTGPLTKGAPLGPFPPATDPDHGYPVGVDPAQYYASVYVPADGGAAAYGGGLVSGTYAGAPNTIFDGHADGTTFSFWTSGTELWEGWCALQTPHPFHLEGMDGYRCVPQGATAANTDLGKLVLCTSMYDEGICSSDDFTPPRSAPCLCLEDAGKNDPRCHSYYQDAVCTCTATHCTANLHLSGGAYTFTVEGNTMRSTTMPSLVLRRVSR